MAKASGAKKNVRSQKAVNRDVDAQVAALAEQGLQANDIALLDLNSEDTVLATSRYGSFQIRPPRSYHHPVTGYLIHEEGWNLEFGLNGATPVDDDTASVIEQILEGEYDNGCGYDPKVLQRNAIEAGLGVKRPGLELPPFPAWDYTSAERVVAIGVAAGVLDNADQVIRAIKFELQRPKRTIGTDGAGKPQKGKPRPEVIAAAKSRLEEVSGVLRQDATALATAAVQVNAQATL